MASTGLPHYYYELHVQTNRQEYKSKASQKKRENYNENKV